MTNQTFVGNGRFTECKRCGYTGANSGIIVHENNGNFLITPFAIACAVCWRYSSERGDHENLSQKRKR